MRAPLLLLLLALAACVPPGLPDEAAEDGDVNGDETWDASAI